MQAEWCSTADFSEIWTTAQRSRAAARPVRKHIRAALRGCPRPDGHARLALIAAAYILMHLFAGAMLIDTAKTALSTQPEDAGLVRSQAAISLAEQMNGDGT